jgi:hypothetical protein
MPTRSQEEPEMKGLDGSNPPRSTSQADRCPALPRPARNSRDMSEADEGVHESQLARMVEFPFSILK